MTVFTCEHEFGAMLSCIYYAWTSGLGHSNIRLEFEPLGQFSLFDEYRHIDYDPVATNKVIDAVNTKISTYFYHELMYSAHYYESDVLDNIYRMMLLGFKFGNQAFDMLQYEAVNRNREIRKAFGTEVCRFREFSRFHEVRKSLYVAHIEPRSRVCIALGPIFMDRMPSENWMVVDDVHKEAVIHPVNSPFYLRSLNDDEFAVLIRTEQENDEYTDLWKVFFDSIAIEERANKKCQQNHMPLWTRKHAVEFIK